MAANQNCRQIQIAAELLRYILSPRERISRKHRTTLHTHCRVKNDTWPDPNLNRLSCSDEMKRHTLRINQDVLLSPFDVCMRNCVVRWLLGHSCNLMSVVGVRCLCGG